MQKEIAQADPRTSVVILGVNNMSEASGNAGFCQSRSLPWLQDVSQVNAWSLWQAEDRDVMVLDASNHLSFVYKLMLYDLSVPANYDTLKARILRLAGQRLAVGDPAPTVSLADVNPNSPTSGTQVSPQAFQNRISCWYFGRATQTRDRDQFRLLNQMQTEVTGSFPRTEVQILGVNQSGETAGNSQICNGQVLPWLQDTAESNAWGTWRAEAGDLVVVGRDSKVAYFEDLAIDSLETAASYDSVEARVERLASRHLTAGDPAPSAALPDVNTQSATYKRDVSPGDFVGRYSCWYFGRATDTACRAQFVELDSLQKGLAAAIPEAGIQVVGVNRSTDALGNGGITAGLALPWLQDSSDSDAWNLWMAHSGDLFLLDPTDHVVFLEDLNSFDLQVPANLDSLKARIIRTAVTHLNPGVTVPQTALLDENYNSMTYGQLRSAADYQDRISCWYFGRATDPACRLQFEILDSLNTAMANDLSLRTEVRILGVNSTDAASGNTAMCTWRHAPWLQDTTTVNAWLQWGAETNDLMVVDRNSHLVSMTNLGQRGLNDPANLEALEMQLGDLASQKMQPGDLMRDVALTDANDSSSTAGQPVSPSIYRGKVSCWFFGLSS